MRTDDIRDKFLQFFIDKGAKLVPSDSLVPSNDPTLLFTGAGMNQFKDYFLGIGKMDFRSATSCQKCMRTGDIGNVGVTPSHHSFFEMLGNFSFGDYFKEEAIERAWEFCTGPMGIPEDRLQISVHITDDEAFNLWKNKIGLPESKINRLGDHDNFWPADAPKLGPNGPCGPCSEIFYDRGADRGCGSADCGITCDCRRWVEIWNLVFTQYERQDGGKLSPLPQRNIDTGAGLERFASCMQGVNTNMDIDIFQPIVRTIAEMADKKYGDKKEDDIIMRRIADHARAVSFCINDGVLPANTHRGYVLKRLLRRAVLNGRNLGIEGAFLAKLIPVVGKVMHKPYPEILARAETIASAVELEEQKFLSTLEKGLSLIDMAVDGTRKQGTQVFSGKTAFELYDTYGFPYELAEEVVESHGMTIDRDGFEEAMNEARERAREGSKMKGDVFAKGPITEVKKLTGGTEFTGYNKDKSEAKIVTIVCGDELVAEIAGEAEVTIVLDRTPFYGKSGGQVGDSGVLLGEGGVVVEINDTLKIDGIHLHVGRVASGTAKTGMNVSAEIDVARRLDIRRNHTTTHLIHYALRQVLGEKAEQKGSHVAPDRLRFDFQHGKSLSRDELRKVEEIVNHKILDDAQVVTEILSIDEARKRGATALFGEKYGDTVRVVSCGDYSMELCGGTHMTRTAPIGSFRILAEESVSAGVRRIEAVTGTAAYRISREQGDIVTELSHSLKVKPESLIERVGTLLGETKVLKKETMVLRREKVKDSIDEVNATEIKGAKVFVKNMGELLGKELADAADAVKRKLGENGVAVIVGSAEDKVGIVITVGKELAPKKLKAGDLVKRLAPIVGGGGGGRPDYAQAGGKDASKVDELLNTAPKVIEELLS